MNIRRKIIPIALPKHDIPAQVYGLSLFLTIVPFVMALRFAVSSIWSEPASFSPSYDKFGVNLPIMAAAVACVLWALFYTSIWAHAYLGGTAALMSMFRAVEISSTSDQIGSTAWVGVIIWATTAMVCMMTAMIGAQYAGGWHHPDHPRWRSEELDVRD